MTSIRDEHHSRAKTNIDITTLIVANITLTYNDSQVYANTILGIINKFKTKVVCVEFRIIDN